MKQSPWLGYSIAPVVAPILYGVFILIIPSTYENKEFSVETWLLSFSIFSIASYTVCLIIGLPLIVLLRYYKKLSFVFLSFIGSILYALIVNITLFSVMDAKIVGNINLTIVKTSLTSLALGVVTTAVYSCLAGIPIFTKRIQ